MTSKKLRQQIAFDAARMMYQREESEYFRAKMKAAGRFYKGRIKPADLPSNAEIREAILQLAQMLEGDSRQQHLQEMRLESLRLMRILDRFKPRLIGSVLTGHIRSGSDIDIHIFSDSLEPVTAELDFHGFRHDTEYKRVRKQGEQTLYRHIHVFDRYEFELTVYPISKTSFPFRSSITGKPIEKANIQQLEELIRREYPNADLDQTTLEKESGLDRFQLYYSLLLPLERVKQNPVYHPEGDALYHSLQVYDRAANQLPYDEEFLLAALLHDVGKGIDPYDHVNSGISALEGYITERTAWLIANHMLAHKIYDRTIGHRQHRRLQENESYPELLLLGECDRAGRCVGVEVTELDDALEYIRQIAF